MVIVFYVISAVLVLFMFKLFIDKKEQIKNLELKYNSLQSEKDTIIDQYKGIINVDDAISKSKVELENTNKEIEKLKEEYSEKRSLYVKLTNETALLEESLEMTSFGVYEPHFDYDTSERFKNQIIQNNQEQKELIKNDKAIICNKEWQVEGSFTKGKAMIDKQKKLMLRAFNGECDTFILKVKWNNVEKMEARVNKAFDAINKMGENTSIYITSYFYKLKLDELYLNYEYQRKLQEEKEEQARIREQIREEEKAQREFEEAQKQAEKETDHYEKALVQARKEMQKAQESEIGKYEAQLKELEAKLQEAQEKKERALSQAQLTKSGHVYVISNIGSFGENIYKIGMTRRLEPLDRVRELGDASVPFRFDVHALIYSSDAPALETTLHKIFKERQVNLVNDKKEFFNVSLNEIKTAVQENCGEIEFTKLAEAQEYRESLSIRQKLAQTETIEQIIEEKFPTSL